MKKSMLFVIICAIVMALAMIGCKSNIKNTNPTDEELASAYVASKFGDGYTYSMSDDEEDDDDGHIHIFVYDENGNIRYGCVFNREWYTKEYLR